MISYHARNRVIHKNVSGVGDNTDRFCGIDVLHADRRGRGRELQVDHPDDLQPGPGVCYNRRVTGDCHGVMRVWNRCPGIDVRRTTIRTAPTLFS